MCLADPTYLAADIQRPQRSETTGTRLDAEKSCQLDAVRPRRRLEDHVGVDSASGFEVQIRESVASVRQHFGEHRNHAVFVLRQPDVGVVYVSVNVSQIFVHFDEVGHDGRHHAAGLTVFVDSLKHLHDRQSQSEQGQHLVGARVMVFPRVPIRLTVQPETGVLRHVPVRGILAEEVNFEPFEELHPREHVPLFCGNVGARWKH